MKVIETERLRLRPLAKDDASDITRLIGQWEVIRWLTSPPWPYRHEDAEAYMEMDACKEAFAITRDNQFMGVAGLHSSDTYPGTELGYWLGVPFHGKGYMTEAAQAVVDFHFDQGAQALYSGYLIGNQPSANVLAKLGFQVGGRHQVASRPLARDVMVQEVRLTAADRNSRNAA